MKTWQKAGIVTLISLTIGGIYLFIVFQQRKNPGVIAQNPPQQTANPDDYAVVRAKFPTTFDDVLKLENTSVWMKNGYTMAYFPYDSGRIVFTKPIGVIPTAQRLDIKKVIKASPPHPSTTASRTAPARSSPSSLSPATPIFTPQPSAPSMAARSSTTLTCFSITTTRTPSTATGPKTSGRPSTRTRSSPA